MDMVPAMALALDASFGSVERWREDFVARAQVPRRVGCVMLAFSPADARLVNKSDVDAAPAAASLVPLLELEGQASIEAFLASIDWADVYARYQQAVERASEGHGAGHDDLGDALVLDVRRKAIFEKAATRLPGADWRDPARVGTWSAEIPAERPVIVYCIYGHEVGRVTALRLRAAGIDARFLQGGIDGWQSAGRVLEPKEVTP
jgi:Fe-Mn family superoxide dismutase